MKKFQSIMKYLDNDYETRSKQIADNVFELETKLPAHKAYIKFDIAGDILRTELQYMFGFLTDNFRRQELIEMLKENVGSFGCPSSFMGLRDIKGTPYTVLSGYYLFHTKWEDKDIATILSLALADIYLNFISWKWSDSVYVFSEKDLR